MNTVTITKYDVEDITVEFDKYVVENYTFETEYKLTTTINKTLKGLGLNRQLPPQMIYNYVGKGTFTKTHDSVVQWLTKYINNNQYKW